MTKSQIIVKAQLYLDDMSELSTQEFSDLFDKMYRKVNSDRPWEGTKKEFTSTVSGTSVALPSDFLYPVSNNNYTDASFESSRPVVFIGSNRDYREIVSWSDRRQYQNSTRHAYIDIAGNTLNFFVAPGNTISMDYHSSMPALANDESPWFPAEFHDMLYHMMVSDDYVIQQSDKAKSYKTENDKMAESYMNSMALWNANLVQI